LRVRLADLGHGQGAREEMRLIRSSVAMVHAATKMSRAASIE